MTFHAYEVSLQLVRSLKPLVEKLGQGDRSLTDQLRRAATSIPLNLAEGNRKQGKSKRNVFRIAAGSANEVRAALDTAQAWGLLQTAETEKARQLLDRELAMLWRLTH